MRGFRIIAALLAAACCGHAVAQVDVDAYIKEDRFEQIKLSPNGDYFAATVPREDRTALVTVSRKTGEITNHFMLTRNTHVFDFDWVSPERVVLSVAQKFGSVDQPYSTGELFAMNASGGRFDMLGGYRAADLEFAAPTARGIAQNVYLEVNDTLAHDDRAIIVSVTSFGRDLKYSTAERMDVKDGRRSVISRSPVKRATFTTDNAGRLRFVIGAGDDNISKLYYRPDDDSEWKLVNDEAVTHHGEAALGFSADNALAYLQVENAQGPDSIVSWNPVSGERKVVLRDAVADPDRILYRIGTRVPVGAMVVSDRPHTLFFDADSPEAKQYRMLEKSMPDEAVLITSGTDDGRLLLVHAWSGSNPGQFFLFDTQARKVQSLFIRRQWINSDQSAQVEAVSLKARDGLPLHGFLTRPRGSEGKALPMVVLPHGGPIGVYDTWDFNDETQMLASAGYAVLQVNYRGSSNYGRAFLQAGAQEWGQAMQDDVTDATRWAIQQGYADASRVCIYGASYGGYAALMGVAKEPALYRCAAGYVGVYDLPMRYSRGAAQETRAGETWLREWMGAPETLAEVSPVNLANRIKVPVFLAAGGEDENAPIAHTRKMAAALKSAGVPVETLYYDSEGHGFYTREHRRAYYTQLLAFLARSLGGQPAKAAAAQP
jgi:dipeptidyl aminopeptidase/acylaminoacyl peptidase